MPYKQLILLFSAFVIALLIVIPPFLSRHAWIYNIASVKPVDPKTFPTPDGWQFDSFRTESGILLPGIVRPATNPSAPWVIFLPGNGGGQVRGAKSYLENLLPADINSGSWGLAAWGMRGFDGTPGEPDTAESGKDNLENYQHIRNTYSVKSENIHLVGFSFGADFSIQLAADLAKQGERPGSISLLSTQGSLPPSRKLRSNKWFSRWLPTDKIDISSAFDLIDSPVLIIEAKDDLRQPIERLIAAFKHKPKYLEFPGGDHKTSWTHPLAIDEVRNWIKRNSNSAPSNQN